MKLNGKMKEDIAREAAIAIIAKKRDATFKTLQKELTNIAKRQFVDIPLSELLKYPKFIYYDNHLQYGKGFPDGFIDTERGMRGQYKKFGFIPSGEVPLLDQFPCEAGEWDIKVNDEYSEIYTKAVRKYIIIFFEAQKNYKLILESLSIISTDKDLEDEFPELLIYFSLPEKEERTIPKEKLAKCKTLLKENRKLFIENL
jgi:hypothetical protein